MSEDYKVQASISSPPSAQYAKGSMVNFRGDTVDEVLTQVEEAISSGLIAKVIEAEKVMLLESGVGPNNTASAVQGATLSQPAASSAVENVVNLRTCPHGKMNGPVEGVAKTGKNAGNKYLRWDCPAGDKSCKSKFENP